MQRLVARRQALHGTGEGGWNVWGLRLLAAACLRVCLFAAAANSTTTVRSPSTTIRRRRRRRWRGGGGEEDAKQPTMCSVGVPEFSPIGCVGYLGGWEFLFKSSESFFSPYALANVSVSMTTCVHAGTHQRDAISKTKFQCKRGTGYFGA
jgi:hypothetical protein